MVDAYGSNKYRLRVSDTEASGTDGGGVIPGWSVGSARRTGVCVPPYIAALLLFTEARRTFMAKVMIFTKAVMLFIEEMLPFREAIPTFLVTFAICT